MLEVMQKQSFLPSLFLSSPEEKSADQNTLRLFKEKDTIIQNYHKNILRSSYNNYTDNQRNGLDTQRYTGCLKKMVIELWSALARSLFNLQKSFFHSRKDQAFSFRMSPFL